MQLYFHDCVCLPWMRRSSDPPPPPCGILHYLFAVSRSADPKYTPPVTITHRTHTHMHTLFGTYDSPFLTHTHLLRRVCSPRLARPLPAARTHIVSHHRPPPPNLSLTNGPQGLELSLRLPRTFSSTCSLIESLLSTDDSVYLCFYVSICWSVYRCPSSPLPLSQVLSPKGDGGGGEALPRGQEPESSPFGFHYKQASTSQKSNNQRGEKNKRRGLKGL